MQTYSYVYYTYRNVDIFRHTDMYNTAVLQFITLTKAIYIKLCSRLKTTDSKYKFVWKFFCFHIPSLGLPRHSNPLSTDNVRMTKHGHSRSERYQVTPFVGVLKLFLFWFCFSFSLVYLRPTILYFSFVKLRITMTQWGFQFSTLLFFLQLIPKIKT